MLYTDDELVGTDPATRARLMERFRESSQIIYVANTTARAQLVTDVASWFTPSSTNPLFVYRGDAAAHAKVECSTDGSTWTPLLSVDTGWVNPVTYNAAWNDTAKNTAQSRVIGRTLYLKGTLQPATGTVGVGVHAGVIQLASGHRPSATVRANAVAWVSGATPPYSGNAAIEIDVNGNLALHAGATLTGVFLDGVSVVL